MTTQHRNPAEEPLTGPQTRALLAAGFSASELATWTKQDGVHALGVLTHRGSGEPVTYAEYMKSPEWRDRSKAALRRQIDGCAVCCSTKRLQVHHRTYARLGHERDTDLVVLCGRCHRKFHGKTYKPPTLTADHPDEADGEFRRLCERDA